MYLHGPLGNKSVNHSMSRGAVESGQMETWISVVVPVKFLGTLNPINPKPISDSLFPTNQRQ